MRKSILSLLCLSLIVWLLGCTVRVPGRRMACNQILDDAAHSIPFEALTPERMQQWLQDTYHHEASDIAVLEFANEQMTKGVAWNWNGKGYGAAFRNEDLRNIVVRWRGTRPTITEVLDCFGEPDFYRAGYSPAGEPGNKLELELWYPEKGLMVGHFRYSHSEQPPAIASRSTMTDLTIVRPGSIEAVVADAYLGRAVEVREKALQALKPWPGTWEDIVVETTVFP